MNLLHIPAADVTGQERPGPRNASRTDYFSAATTRGSNLHNFQAVTILTAQQVQPMTTNDQWNYPVETVLHVLIELIHWSTDRLITDGTSRVVAALATSFPRCTHATLNHQTIAQRHVQLLTATVTYNSHMTYVTQRVNLSIHCTAASYMLSLTDVHTSLP